MRSKKVLINSIFGLAGYLVFMLSNLITRSVFTSQLGLSMAGVDTTFKNFLHVLSLAELGLSTGLIYKLYKPLEEKDNSAIKRVLNFYKQAYKVIALIFMGGAVVLSFIVTFFVTDTEYTDFVVIHGTISADKLDSFTKGISETTSGRCKLEVVEKKFGFRE